MTRSSRKNESSIKKVSAVFWFTTVMSIAAYIAYAVAGIIFYRKLGRYPSTAEYLSMIFKYHEPVETIYSAYDYMKKPDILVGFLTGLKFMLVGMKYKYETGNGKTFIAYSTPFVCYSIYALSALTKPFINVVPKITVILATIALFVSVIVSFIQTFKVFKSSCRSWIIAILAVEVFRLIVLTLILDLTAIGIKKIIGYAVLIIILYILFSGGSDGAVGMDTRAFAHSDSNKNKEINKLLADIEKEENAMRTRSKNLKLGSFWGGADASGVRAANSRSQRNIEIDKKNIQRLKNKK